MYSRLQSIKLILMPEKLIYLMRDSNYLQYKFKFAKDEETIRFARIEPVHKYSCRVVGLHVESAVYVYTII